MNLRARVGSWSLFRSACLAGATLGALLPSDGLAQAIMSGYVVFPTPNSGLPTPAEAGVTGYPSGGIFQGQSYYGTDRALVADVLNHCVHVVRISTASALERISAPGQYDGYGTIAVAPAQNFALASGSIGGATQLLAVIAAPFGAGSVVTTVALPGFVPSYQTQAIAFNAAGRAFVYHTTGISVVDPPYSTIAFTIPVANAFGGGIAISPNGNTLLATLNFGAGSNMVQIFTAPFSAASTAALLTVPGSNLDGIQVTPDGNTALVATSNQAGVAFAIAAPFTAASTVETLPGSPSFVYVEDVSISADGQLAIFTGDGASTAFVRAPFTAAGATVFAVNRGGNAASTRFRPGALAAQSMAVDALAAAGTSSNHNGVLESGETVLVAPAWENTLLTSATFTGTAANLTGPAGPTYTLDDTSADYGTVGIGATGDCQGATANCYRITVSGPRPVAHWDAAFTETLDVPNPAPKPWTLHVGGSFPDVPASDQFYGFIETLFHHGVTGGCGGGNYCPTTSVTRAQMAVFLLKAKYGPAHVPTPCTGVFDDVTCPGPFTDWIEELSSYGITGGCGNGNYCPGNPVTRAQMAVFLLKSEHGPLYAPPACAGTFPDVACPGQFTNWIEQLFVENITGGCGGGNYCPSNPNTRGQMAVFLARTFGLKLYGP